MLHQWTLSCLLLAGLCSSARAAVELRDIQACHGRYGPARTSLEVAPHDELMFRFVIAGLKTAADGKTDATLTITLTDKSGAEVLRQPQTIRTAMPFGDDSCPGTASLLIGTTAPPGEYHVRVSVEDKLATGSARFIRKIVIKPVDFRLLNPRFFSDPGRTMPGPGGGFVGQTLYLRTQVASPTRRDGRTAVVLTLRVVDLDGNEVMKPSITARREVTSDTDFHAIAVEAELPLGRAGEYRLIVIAVDENSRRETTAEYPLSIHLP